MHNDPVTNQIIVDVREPDEFNSESVPGSAHLPLSKLDSEAPKLMKNIIPGQKIVLMCKSGQRALMAEQRLRKLGLTSQGQCIVYEGGILEWKRRGGAISRHQSTSTKVRGVPPVMQQVQLTIGTLLLLSSILSALVSLKFLAVSALIGAGLLAAGLTGQCMLAALLSKMPWNKNG